MKFVISFAFVVPDRPKPDSPGLPLAYLLNNLYVQLPGNVLVTGRLLIKFAAVFTRVKLLAVMDAPPELTVRSHTFNGAFPLEAFAPNTNG